MSEPVSLEAIKQMLADTAKLVEAYEQQLELPLVYDGRVHTAVRPDGVPYIWKVTKSGHRLETSPEDEPKLLAYEWCVMSQHDVDGRPTHYARSSGRMVSLHGLIMDPPKGMVVHHKDHNGLNNQRDNLEVITYGENNRRRRKAKNAEPVVEPIADHQQELPLAA